MGIELVDLVKLNYKLVVENVVVFLGLVILGFFVKGV